VEFCESIQVVILGDENTNALFLCKYIFPVISPKSEFFFLTCLVGMVRCREDPCREISLGVCQGEQHRPSGCSSNIRDWT
jgi:hypothetical protein